MKKTLPSLVTPKFTSGCLSRKISTAMFVMGFTFGSSGFSLNRHKGGWGGGRNTQVQGVLNFQKILKDIQFVIYNDHIVAVNEML